MQAFQNIHPVFLKLHACLRLCRTAYIKWFCLTEDFEHIKPLACAQAGFGCTTYVMWGLHMQLISLRVAMDTCRALSAVSMQREWAVLVKLSLIELAELDQFWAVS